MCASFSSLVFAFRIIYTYIFGDPLYQRPMTCCGHHRFNQISTLKIKFKHSLGLKYTTHSTSSWYHMFCAASVFRGPGICFEDIYKIIFRTSQGLIRCSRWILLFRMVLGAQGHKLFEEQTYEHKRRQIRRHTPEQSGHNKINIYIRAYA